MSVPAKPTARGVSTSPSGPIRPTAGIGGIGYAFPAETRSVRELAAAGLLESEPELLEEFGFGTIRMATRETPYELALEAARQALDSAGADPESVGTLLYAGTPGTLAFAPAEAPPDGMAAWQTLDRFKYPAARLQHELGLVSAQLVGLDQLACLSLFAAVRLARLLCAAEGVERVLCVAAEFFPARAGREAIFNCTSDAAVAVLVEAAGERNRILSSAHVSKGYYWDCDALRNEIVASYFPTARHVIDRALEGARWRPDDVDWVIPHNVSVRSWQILMGIAGLPRARVWLDNVARHGHTLAGDNFINLRDGLAAGSILPGQRLLLFSYGFGAHWAALTLEA